MGCVSGRAGRHTHLAEKLAHAGVGVGIAVLKRLNDVVGFRGEPHGERFRDGSCGGEDLRVVAHRLGKYLSKRRVGGTKEKGGSYYMREMEQPGVMEEQLEELCEEVGAGLAKYLGSFFCCRWTCLRSAHDRNGTGQGQCTRDRRQETGGAVVCREI